MIAVIGICHIKPDRHEQFRAVFLELIAKIRANEPDTLVYELTASRTDPDQYKVLEVYRSEAALAAHQATAYFQAAGPALIKTFAAPPELEFLDTVDVPAMT